MIACTYLTYENESGKIIKLNPGDSVNESMWTNHVWNKLIELGEISDNLKSKPKTIIVENKIEEKCIKDSSFEGYMNLSNKAIKTKDTKKKVK